MSCFINSRLTFISVDLTDTAAAIFSNAEASLSVVLRDCQAAIARSISKSAITPIKKNVIVCQSDNVAAVRPISFTSTIAGCDEAVSMSVENIRTIRHI